MSEITPAKKLHPRNRHLDDYNFAELSRIEPQLKQYLFRTESKKDTVDFSNPDVVRLLNSALLKKYYHIQYWDIPKENLCPSVPGRADYIHYVADILARDHNGEIPKGTQIRILDIGVGANCIYPIIGHQEYGWSFVGSEIIKKAYKNAIEIIRSNMSLKKSIQIRLQKNPKAIFDNIIDKSEKFDMVICNPPFFASQTEAIQQSIRKATGEKAASIDQNKVTQAFGGQGSELWCEGGEKAFLSRMIDESQFYRSQVKRFSTLVPHREYIRLLQHKLKKVGAKDVEVIRMEQGNKVSRILCWRFE